MHADCHPCRAPTSCRSEKAEAAALHHRAKRELGEVMAALKRSYADARAEAAAGYRLMVGAEGWGWGRGLAWPCTGQRRQH